MADMARAGTLNLSVLEERVFPLEQVNEAIAAGSGAASPGGFANVVVQP